MKNSCSIVAMNGGDDKLSRRVTFSKRNTVKLVSPKQEAEYEADILTAKERILSFLKEDVFDVIEELGRHLRGNMNSDFVDHEYIAHILARMAESIYGKKYALKYFDEMLYNYESYNGKTSAELIRDALHTPEGDILRDSATLLIRAGLKDTIEFKHCVNECSKNPGWTLKRACSKAHKEIESMLGAKISKFDALLRKASHDVCAIAPQKLPTIRFGSKKT